MTAHLLHLLTTGLEVAAPQLEAGWLSIPMLAALMCGMAILTLPFVTAGVAFVVWLVNTSMKFKSLLDDKASKAEAKAMVDGLRTEREREAKPVIEKIIKMESDINGKANAAEILPPLRTLETKTAGQDVVLGGLQKDVTHLTGGVSELKTGNAQLQASQAQTQAMLVQVLQRLPPLLPPHDPKP